jgi:ribosomal protein S18 acetylase RimI-like enzyme
MTIVIRNAVPADIGNLTALMTEYIVDFYKKPKPPIEKLNNLITLLLDHAQGIQFVAEQDGKMVGFATLYFSFSTMKSDKITIMNDLYVIEEVRGKDVDASLFNTCQNYTRNNGYAHMTWVTAPENERAQRLYDKMAALRVDWINYLIL